MRMSATVRPIAGRGFLAESFDPIAARAEAATRDEALEGLRALIEGRLKSGVEVVTLEVDNGRAASSEAGALAAKEPHPLAEVAGDLKDSPLLGLWKDAMAEYRRQRDADDA